MAGFGVDRDSAAGGSGSSASAIPVAIIDVKGDLVVGTAADTAARLAAGANDTILMADSAQTAGLKWGSPATVRTALGLSDPMALGTIVDAKGDIIAATADNTPARKAVGTDGQALHADSSQTTGLVYVDNPSRPNLLVNPNWQIDQITEGGLYTFNGAAGNGPDGWSGEVVGGGGGVFKVRTLADPDNAALKCLEITCTTIDAAIAAGERYSIFSAVEGYDATSLMAGTASAQSVTLQFKFKTSVAGVYGISLANSAKNRSYVGIINVADALEHEYSLIVPMDTAGTWLYTNGVGLYMRLTLAGGANFQATAGAWNAADNYCTAAQANFMSNIANIAYLKRIQLIPGALVQAYRPADIQKELAKAQRYFSKTWNQGTAVGSLGNIGCRAFVTANGTNGEHSNSEFPVEMRTTPTLTYYSTVTGTPGTVNAGGGDIAAAATGTLGSKRYAGFGVPVAATTLVLWHDTAKARLS